MKFNKVGLEILAFFCYNKQIIETKHAAYPSKIPGPHHG